MIALRQSVVCVCQVEDNMEKWLLCVARSALLLHSWASEAWKIERSERDEREEGGCHLQRKRGEEMAGEEARSGIQETWAITSSDARHFSSTKVFTYWGTRNIPSQFFWMKQLSGVLWGVYCSESMQQSTMIGPPLFPLLCCVVVVALWGHGQKHGSIPIHTGCCWYSFIAYLAIALQLAIAALSRSIVGCKETIIGAFSWDTTLYHRHRFEIPEITKWVLK